MNEPWKLTRDLFLSELEAVELIRFLDQRVAASPGDQTAWVDRLIIQLLLYTGLRNSELCRLRVGDLKSLTDRPAVEVCGTRNQDRTVCLPRSLGELLAKYLEEIRPHSLSNDSDPRDPSLPVLVNERGRPYERTSLYRRVVRILTAAGFGSRASVQFLRHSYGYLAYKRTGGNLIFVQKQLGHVNPIVTSIYVEFVEEDYSALAERMRLDAAAPDAT